MCSFLEIRPSGFIGKKIIFQNYFNFILICFFILSFLYLVRNIYWDMFFGQTLDQNAPKFLTSGF
jgi:hypothetical protein